MTIFTHPLWGYSLLYPDNWIHQTSTEVEAFATSVEALDVDKAGPRDGHCLIRGEFNYSQKNIDLLWKDHLLKLGFLVGAKNVGAAPLIIGGGAGYEAEIVLPKTKNQRLWTGILSYGLTILHLAVSHPLDQREWFQPLATSLVASLRFTSKTEGLECIPEGIPVPKGYTPAEPASLLSNIEGQQGWLTFSGQALPGALQVFYLRELPHLGWEITEFSPYPNQENPGFARFQMRKQDNELTLAILPSEAGHGNIVIKQHSSSPPGEA